MFKEPSGEFDPRAQALAERGFVAGVNLTDPVIPDDFGDIDPTDSELLDAAAERAKDNSAGSDTWENEGGQVVMG